MKALRDAIFARMASEVQRDVMQFRIAGGAVNVARFLSGSPDCFMARVKSNQVKDLRSRKVLRMVVNVGARGSVSADTFFARGRRPSRSSKPLSEPGCGCKWTCSR